MWKLDPAESVGCNSTFENGLNTNISYSVFCNIEINR